MSSLRDKKILVTGGHGFLGSFVIDYLVEKIGISRNDLRVPKSAETDLRLMDDCIRSVDGIDIVLHIAGRGGGIGYNRRCPGTLFYDNITMNTHLMEAARCSGVEKFLGVGTVCAYPKYTPVPFKEDDLWNGYPEETNASYGLSKKMMLVQSQAYRQQYGFNSIICSWSTSTVRGTISIPRTPTSSRRWSGSLSRPREKERRRLSCGGREPPHGSSFT